MTDDVQSRSIVFPGGLLIVEWVPGRGFRKAYGWFHNGREILGPIADKPQTPFWLDDVCERLSGVAVFESLANDGRAFFHVHPLRVDHMEPVELFDRPEHRIELTNDPTGEQ